MATEKNLILRNHCVGNVTKNGHIIKILSMKRNAVISVVGIGVQQSIGRYALPVGENLGEGAHCSQ